jgi:PAS domain S-box-containing protein
MQILHIDDSKTERTLISGFLGATHEVISVEDGQQGLVALREHHKTIDVVLLDVEMPHINGLQLLRRAKLDSQLQLLPFIMLTSRETDAAESLRLGAIGCLAKPVSQDFMLAKLQVIQEKKALENRLLDQNRTMEEILNQTNVGLLIFNSSGEFIFANRTAKILFDHELAFNGVDDYQKRMTPIDFTSGKSARHDVLLQQDASGLAMIKNPGRLDTPISYHCTTVNHADGSSGLLLTIADISKQRSSDAIANKLHDEATALADILSFTMSSDGLEQMLINIGQLVTTTKAPDLENWSGIFIVTADSESPDDYILVDSGECSAINLSIPDESKIEASWLQNELHSIARYISSEDPNTQHLQDLLALPLLDKKSLLGFALTSRDTKAPESSFASKVIDLITMGIRLRLDMKRLRDSTRQSAMREANQRLLVNSLTLAVIGVDSSDQIIHFNPAAEKMFGISTVKAVGKPIIQLGLDLDWVQLSSMILDCNINKSNQKPIDALYKNIAGEERVLSTKITPILDDESNSKGYLLLCEDVTDNRFMIDQAQQSAKLQSIGQLAAGIAHEINTPIQYIGDNVDFFGESIEQLHELLSSYSQLLKAVQEETSTIEHVKNIQNLVAEIDPEYLLEELPIATRQTKEGVNTVAEIVRAMKDFSHPGEENKSQLDLNRAIQSTVTVTRNEWKYFAEVELDLNDEVREVTCFPGQINEVILNLIVNAAHAIRDSLPEESATKGLIKISSQIIGDYYRVTISDSGTGIPVNIRHKIFDPFFTTKKLGEGTGQGLSLSYRIITQSHGGKLRFETELGQGTSFIIELPVGSRP